MNTVSAFEVKRLDSDYFSERYDDSSHSTGESRDAPRRGPGTPLGMRVPDYKTFMSSSVYVIREPDS